MSKTIQVFGFPRNASVDLVKSYVESYTGDGTVYACKVRETKSRNGALSAYALIQFNDEGTAKSVLYLANSKSIRYIGHYLNARRVEQDIVPKPRMFMHRIQGVTLFFGCQTSNNVFARLWKKEDVSVDFGFGMRRINFVLSYQEVEHRLELNYENIWQMELRCPRDEFTSKYLLIQVIYVFIDRRCFC